MVKKNQHKRQAAILKKRRKDKARKKHQRALAPAGSRNMLRKARQFPIYECKISDDWQSDMGLVQIVIAREQPDGNIAFGVYLIDKFCLGLKNTFANANFSVADYEDDVLGHVEETTTLMPCSPELAHQFVYQAIDYAAQYGFKPDKDYKWSKLVLTPRGELEESAKIEFGKDGKPFFVSGPYDNIEVILAKLEQNAGAGNYHYMAHVGDPLDDDHFPFELIDGDVESDDTDADDTDTDDIDPEPDETDLPDNAG